MIKKKQLQTRLQLLFFLKFIILIPELLLSAHHKAKFTTCNQVIV